MRAAEPCAPMAANQPGLAASVVICTYTLARWAELQRAVGSVLAQRRPPVEVIVVVDHNTELLARARRQWPVDADRVGPPVRVVGSVGTAGLSAARNTGVDAAVAEIVAFLDDDAEAEAGWAELLVAAYADPATLACGGAAIPVLIDARPPWWPSEFDWVVGCSHLGLPTSRSEIRNVIGASMSLRRAALIELGGFAEGVGRVGSLPFGCEETDLCIRLSQRWPSGRIVYQPAARVHHAVSAERMSWGYFRARCFAEGRSKAIVAGRVGRARALSSERHYTLRVLPRGIARGLFGACRGEQGAGLRAGAIGAGLAITTAGYIRGRLGWPSVAAPRPPAPTQHRAGWPHQPS
jgi:GT2 family glycosyltransferase